MRISGRLENYEHIPCEVKIFPLALPYYFAIQHFKALENSKGSDYWAHIAFLATELIPILNLIPFAIDYFAGKKESIVIKSPKRESINEAGDFTSYRFAGYIFEGKEKEACAFFEAKLCKKINLPFSLGFLCLGNTVLHYACYMRMNSLIKLLIENGADIELKNDDQKTPKNLYELEGNPQALLGNDSILFRTERPPINPNELNQMLELLTPKI